MYTVARRKLASHSALLYHQRSLAAASGLSKISARELKYLRPASRQYSSFLSSSSSRARPRGLRPGQTLFRQIHARAISYSSIPRFVARAFKVPIAGATVGAGGLTYANYKYEGTLCYGWLCHVRSSDILVSMNRAEAEIASLDQYRERYCCRCLRHRFRWS